MRAEAGATTSASQTRSARALTTGGARHKLSGSMEDEVEVAGVDRLLLVGLRRMLEKLGHHTFVSGPLLVHDRACFPDAWDADALGVHRASRRVLVHLGAPELRVRLVDTRSHDDPEAREDLVTVVDVEEDTVTLNLAGMATPALLLPQLAFELAGPVVLRADRGTAGYRADERDVPLPGATSRSLALFVLGFGVIALSGSAVMLKRELVGGLVQGEWIRLSVGGFPAQVCATLLAAQVVVRNRDESASIAARLHDDLRPLFEDAVQALVDQREPLLAALGLPPEDGWPPLREVEAGPLPPDTEGEAEAVAAQAGLQTHLEQPLAGKVGFRVPTTYGLQAGTAGVGVGVLVAVVSGATAPLWLVPALGFLIGRFFVQRARCSECDLMMGADARVCSRCGVTLVGEIGHRNERLEAAEAYEREQTGDD
jgi:hypothetical protein